MLDRDLGPRSLDHRLDLVVIGLKRREASTHTWQTQAKDHPTWKKFIEPSNIKQSEMTVYRLAMRTEMWC